MVTKYNQFYRIVLVLIVLLQHTIVLSFNIIPLSSLSLSSHKIPKYITTTTVINTCSTTVPNVVPACSYRHIPRNMVLTSNVALDSNNNDDDDDDDDGVIISNVGVVILAGGTGSRMKASLPKQFLILDEKPILHHSIELFLQQPFVPTSPQAYFHHVVLVLDPMYQPEYQYMIDKYNGRLSFANPGKERQGSVENGLNQLIQVSTNTNSNNNNNNNNTPNCSYVAIHDSARPLVTTTEIINVIRDAKRSGTAAVLSVPCKATIKESSDQGVSVLRTIPRERLYEVHTPQVIRIDLLREGFEQVRQNSWSVTDDVSIIEQLNKTVILTRGEYTNIKITTPEDMEVAEAILRERKQQQQQRQKQNNPRWKIIIQRIVTVSNTIWDKVSFWKRNEIDFQI